MRIELHVGARTADDVPWYELPVSVAQLRDAFVEAQEEVEGGGWHPVEMSQSENGS
jgi:hypothetical protein